MKKRINKEISLQESRIDGEKEKISQKRKNLETAIKSRGIKRRELAEMIHVSDRQIGHYINGTTNIPKDMLLRLSEILGVSTRYIEGKTDNPEDGMEGILKDMQDSWISTYKPIVDLLKSVDIHIEYDNNTKQLFMYPRGIAKPDDEPIPFDPQLYQFFLDRIRNYSKHLFEDYYRSSHSFNYQLEILKQTGNILNTDETMKEGDTNDLV